MSAPQAISEAKVKMKLGLIPLNDKRGEEDCSQMYNFFERFIVRFKVRRNLKVLGYKLKKDILNEKELLILDKSNNLIGKLKTERVYSHYNNKKKIKYLEPIVSLGNIEHLNYNLREAILKAGCSIT